MSTPEQRSFHLWVNFRTSDDNSPETNQLIDVFGCEVAHEGDFIEVSDSDHQFVLFGDSFLMLKLFHFIADEVLFIEGLEDMVEAGNHFGREVDELKINLSIELFQMLSLNFENVSF